MPRCREAERMDTRQQLASAEEALTKTKAAFKDKIERLRKRKESSDHMKSLLPNEVFFLSPELA